MAKSQRISNVPNIPAFEAYRSTNQSITSATWTKVEADAKMFDTAGAYDNTTNYRFTPLTAGYYLVGGSVTVVAASGLTAVAAGIYKNGGPHTFANQSAPSSATGGGASVTAIVQMNGTTDYVELWGQGTGTTVAFTGATTANQFFATLIRVL